MVVIAIATYDHAVVVQHGPPCGACIWQACLSDVQASSFRASSGLEPAFFVISGFGRVRVVQNLLQTGGRASIYVHTGP